MHLMMRGNVFHIFCTCEHTFHIILIDATIFPQKNLRVGFLNPDSNNSAALFVLDPIGRWVSVDAKNSSIYSSSALWVIGHNHPRGEKFRAIQLLNHFENDLRLWSSKISRTQMPEGSSEQHSGWAYIWSHKDWKERFIVLSSGKMQVYESDQRKKLKRTFLLRGTGYDDTRLLRRGSFLSRSAPFKFHLWRSSAAQSIHDDLPMMGGTILAVGLPEGNEVYVMVANQQEARTWKDHIGSAAVLGSSRQSLAMLSNSDKEKHFGRLLRASLSLPKSLRSSLSFKDAKRNNKPLEGSMKKYVGPLWPDLDSLKGCTDFLMSSHFNHQALVRSACMIDRFKVSYHKGVSSMVDEVELDSRRRAIRRIIKALVTQLLVSNSMLESCKVHEESLEQLWNACEVWVLSAVYDNIMEACKQVSHAKDKSLEKRLCKLDMVDPSLLGVRMEYRNILSKEIVEQFGRINNFATPLEKAVCLQKTFQCILSSAKLSGQGCGNNCHEPCTDDLLSFMLLLMVRGKVQYLQANALLLDKFVHMRELDGHKGELGYHITNFVAACDYLQSVEMHKLIDGLETR